MKLLAMDSRAVQVRQPADDRCTGWQLGAWSAVAAFGTYFCMYAFRKPFTAAAYEETYWGVGYKTLLVTAQVFGYTASKFLGIKFIAEMKPQGRALGLLGLIGIAQIALLAFGIVPPPWNAVCLFFNGLPLGMVFGLVLGYLEGRRQTEALTAGLCASFIVADGATRSAGAYLLAFGVSEYWMPFLVGILFLLPTCGFVWMLSRIAPPSPEDETARSKRMPMNRNERKEFFRRYARGLTLLVGAYVLITVLRSIRSDFAPEIWAGLQVEGEAGVFAQSETLVGLGVIILYGLVVLVRDNRKAFFLGMFLAGAGMLLIVLAVWAQQTASISAFTFMVVIGLGLYLPYVAVHTTLLERLMAITRDRGNIGYLMYLADAFGYLGYTGVMIAHNLIGHRDNLLGFFVNVSWIIGLAGALLVLLCWRYFAGVSERAHVSEINAD